MHCWSTHTSSIHRNQLRRRASCLSAVLLLALGCAFLLFCTAAHAANNPPGSFLVTYFNFNDNNETADLPGAQLTPTITQIGLNPTFVSPGSTLNIATGDPVTGTTGNNALRLTYPDNGTGARTFQFTFNTLALSNISLSYATRASLNSVFTQTIAYQVGTGAFTNIGTFAPTTTFQTAGLFNLGSDANNQASVTIRITITPSNGQKDQFNEFDNIQVTSVPEPATVAAGVLAVLALFWNQRRQLSKVRLRSIFVTK